MKGSGEPWGQTPAGGTEQVQGAIDIYTRLHFLLEGINRLWVGEVSLFSNLKGSHFMLGENRVSDRKRRTLPASSAHGVGHQDRGPQPLGYGPPCPFRSAVSLGQKIKCTINVTLLNHLETTPTLPRSVEKLSSVKLVPGAKNVGDHCIRRKCPHQTQETSFIPWLNLTITSGFITSVDQGNTSERI